MDLIYHYTTLDIFKRILKQGFILPDRNEPQNKTEIPTVTFSADQEWEQTRFRVGRLPNGQMVLLSKPLLQHFCGDLIRIGVQRETAPMDWHEMKDRVGLSREATKGIYDFALKVGARTSHWFGTFEAVPEDKWICVQVLKDQTWTDLEELPNLDDVNLDEPAPSVVDMKFDKPAQVDVPLGYEEVTEYPSVETPPVDGEALRPTTV